MSLRRVLPTALALVLVLLIVWSVWAAFGLLSAADDIRAADEILREQSSFTIDAFLTGDLDAPALEAAVLLGRAHDRLDAPLMRPGRWLPVLGRQLSAATAISGSLEELIDVSVSGGSEVRAALDADETLDVQFAMAASALGRVNAVVFELDLGPDEALIGPLAEARREIDDKLERFGDAARDAEGVARELGELLSGPESHLLLVANNAEMRAGSGMILTTGVLRAENGLVVVSDLGLSFARNLEVGAVELTTTYEEHFGFLTPEAEWRNLAATPRFPETAESALRMWNAATGESLDGVVLIDPYMLSALMKGTGPAVIDGVEYDSDSILQYLLHDQYLTIDVEQTNTERRAQERTLAPLVLGALAGGNLDVATLLPAVIDALEQRHLMLWSPDGDRQSAWADADLDGELDADSLMVSSQNRSPSKLDYFIEVRAGLSSQIVGDVRRVELQIALDNTVDIAVEPWYVTGPQPWDDTPVQVGEYVTLLTVNLPGAATNASIDGVEDLSVAGADGPTRIIATTLSVMPGDRELRTVRFDLPVSQTEIYVEPSARADPIRWTLGDVSHRDGTPYVLDLASLD
jgi:hypothetical protein